MSNWGDQPFLLAVLGDVSDPGVEDLAGRQAGDVPAGERYAAGQHGAQPHERLGQLGLAVALDTGDAQDLARPDLERYPVDGHVAQVVGDGEVSHLEYRLAEPGRAFVEREVHGSPDHLGGQLVIGRRRRQ